MNESHQTGGHANESLRFVQLSDLHLSSIELSNPLLLINKRMLGYLSWLRKRRHIHQRWVLELATSTLHQLEADHYAITGDLTHIGLKHEFIQVKEWLDKLGHANVVTVIPGNHDLYVNEKWERSFKLWEPYLLGDKHIEDTQLDNKNETQSDNALTRLNQIYPIVRYRKHVAFIGMNSVFDAPWFRATGQLHKQQLSRLQTILSQADLKKFCKVLLIHHPITLTHTPRRKCLLNHEALTSLLKNFPVDIVLHGHGHHSCLDEITSNNKFNIPVIGMSSSSSISQTQNYQAEFLLFDVKQNNNHWEISKQNHTLDINSRKFIPGKIDKFISPRDYA